VRVVPWWPTVFHAVLPGPMPIARQLCADIGTRMVGCWQTSVLSRGSAFSTNLSHLHPGVRGGGIRKGFVPFVVIPPVGLRSADASHTILGLPGSLIRLFLRACPAPADRFSLLASPPTTSNQKRKTKIPLSIRHSVPGDVALHTR
jgi:hypothetical protein